jgi:hypothetical protein
MNSLLQDFWLWLLTQCSGGASVITIDAHQKLLEAIDDFNAELEAQRREDETGGLH